ncbi:Uu.00g126520.m01.CDS01 [Anthostomella pinea]|uniref:Uu.00g126520.m01.CDS01 n=1 Tax=Anthostomella pinea TaxID=933095 RepID=A0AAI8VHW6_9PEZI|nr:Uu.00g126520.m01.CDS01 [Anthostomella pinea]
MIPISNITHHGIRASTDEPQHHPLSPPRTSAEAAVAVTNTVAGIGGIDPAEVAINALNDGTAPFHQVFFASLCWDKTSRRPRDIGGSFASRRGHANQLSISDSSHHITETIGTMYGDDDDDQHSDSRPMSFIAAPRGGEQIPDRRGPEPPSPEEHPLRLVRSTSDKTSSQGPPHSPGGPNGNPPTKSHTLPLRMPSQRSTRNDGGSSPVSSIGPMSPTLRDMREASEYPLTNIDNPNDIAQELSNLQALRRMSMDVSNNSDPDIIPYQGMSLVVMPSVAPSGDDEEGDPSRLLWVPAGVHPELSPSEFKNFVEKRVQSMKRRSGESTLSVDGLDRSNSGSLRRKKSMLSRQINSAPGQGVEGYVDGAERLERKRSQGQSRHAPSELTIDELVKDPTKAVRKLTLESQARDDTSNMDDMPILPAAPGVGLRRSTRTTYRKGGSLKNRLGGSALRSEERLPFSKRIAARKTEEETGGSTVTESPIEAPKGFGLSRVQSEPISAENFSRPTRSVRRQQTFTQDPKTDPYESSEQQDIQESQQSQTMPSRPPASGRKPPNEPARSSIPVPQIIETPAIEKEPEPQSTDHRRPFPERSSSQKNIVQPTSPPPSSIPAEPPARSSRRPNYGQPLQTSTQPQASNKTSHTKGSRSGSNQTITDMKQNPTPLPGSGGGNNRTDTSSLTFIPTFSSEEKKPEKKSKKDKGDSDGGSSKGASWKWFQKSDDKEKKKKDEENRKSKTKTFVEKAHDNVRLDVLQTSIDTALHKGRESLLLDRDNVDSKLEEERRKESSRKSGEQKKEKDGLFASFFSSSKKKGDRDSGGRKSQIQRPVSPKPAPYQALRPDVDYHWTRFPILEERAIYRMAHIKLANPRRALYSQVLLSNFMYAYLAKVQAMHPQIQVPQSPQQKRLQEEERRRREQEQQYMEQQQSQDSIDRYNFEYHRSTGQYEDPSMQHEAGDYPEAAEIYDYDHNKDQMDQDGGYQEADDYGNHDGGKDYYYGHQDGRRGQEEEEEMW